MFRFADEFAFFWTQGSARADEILVSAAASLTDALKDIGTAYQIQSKHKILLTLGPSNFLARQIDEGAPADIFFSRFSADGLTGQEWAAGAGHAKEPPVEPVGDGRSLRLASSHRVA